jgi:hypothetical protein
MSSTTAPDNPADEYDPVFLHSRREAVIIFGLWVVALLWSVPYCYFTGYGQFDAATFETVLGVPKWLFWGIFVPWLAADAFTIWFCFGYMKEDDLGEAHEGADLAEEIAEMHADDDRKGDGA